MEKEKKTYSQNRKIMKCSKNQAGWFCIVDLQVVSNSDGGTLHHCTQVCWNEICYK